MVNREINRDVWVILGLPFDALDMNTAVQRVYDAVDNNLPCFISTPNLNFLIACQTDDAFRRSVINSDLSMADGMPLIWIARLLRIPLKERVAGSGLIEALIHSKSRVSNPVKVFFFGGVDDVAQQACQILQQTSCGISCVGSLNPGFGTVEEMSQPHIIEMINRSGAEFVIVSLGARKGQSWIEKNRKKLDAPVMSHLGAVVNFIAGTIERAPPLWQRLGLEWLWRIKEEPALWKRYFFDGLGLLKLLITRLLPYALLIYFNRKKSVEGASVSITVDQNKGGTLVTMEGVAVSGNLQTVREAFDKILEHTGEISIDLMHVDYVDPSFVGLLLVLYKHVGERLKITATSPLVRKIIVYNGVRFLLR